MKTFMPDLPPDQRLQLLKDNCDDREETTYYKDLSQDDLDIKRESLSDNLVKLSEWEDELTYIKKEHKVKSDPLKVQNKILLTEIKTRKQEVTGVLYHIADHEQGIMETYDEQGEFVSSRRLRPNEKQQKLFPVSRAANG
jgi:hypothetical protein